ncbi:MAG: hypothetical protein JNM69_28130 [Archangium sp.]|nr:hypothetical protein [Archangium sp.]
MASVQPMLKLALLDELERRRHQSWEWVESVLPPELARAWSEWPSGTHNPDAEAWLLELPLDDDALRHLTSLTLDGDRDVYRWVFDDWWHEGEHCCITSLDGLERCTTLTSLTLGQGVVRRCSLRPLAQLTHLERLSLCALDEHTDEDALLHVRSVEVSNLETSPTPGRWLSASRRRS